MFCPNCGSQIEDGMKFCTNCGAKVELETIINEKVEEAKTKVDEFKEQVEEDANKVKEEVAANINIAKEEFANKVNEAMEQVTINEKGKSETLGKILGVFSVIVFIVMIILLFIFYQLFSGYDDTQTIVLKNLLIALTITTMLPLSILCKVVSNLIDKVE